MLVPVEEPKTAGIAAAVLVPAAEPTAVEAAPLAAVAVEIPVAEPTAAAVERAAAVAVLVPTEVAVA